VAGASRRRRSVPASRGLRNARVPPRAAPACAALVAICRASDRRVCTPCFRLSTGMRRFAITASDGCPLAPRGGASAHGATAIALAADQQRETTHVGCCPSSLATVSKAATDSLAPPATLLSESSRTSDLQEAVLSGRRACRRSAAMTIWMGSCCSSRERGGGVAAAWRRRRDLPG